VTTPRFHQDHLYAQQIVDYPFVVAALKYKLLITRDKLVVLAGFVAWHSYRTWSM